MKNLRRWSARVRASANPLAFAGSKAYGDNRLRLRVWSALLLMFASGPILAAPDYVREKKWADEITPSIVVGDPVYLEQQNGHKFLGIYAPAENSAMAVVIAHGKGIHPDWGMIGVLRQRLVDRGFATLAIQMPVLHTDVENEAYLSTFSEAIERFRLAVAFLKERGYKRIAIVSHSLGSLMAHAYMLRDPPDVNAWAALGIPAELVTKSATSYAAIKAPVLDLYGAKDEPQVLAGAAKRKASLKDKVSSKQVVIPNADHFFAGQEEAMIKAVVDFLNSVT